MGLLAGTSVYLIGAIDHANDPRKWRREITNKLLLPLGVKVYDPLIKPSWIEDEFPFFEDVDPSEDFRVFKLFLKDPQAYNKEARPIITNRMKGIRKLCMRMANNADFIIGAIPKKFTVGTLEELGVAAQSGKPILLYLPDGIDSSTWLPAQLGPSFFENSFVKMEDLYDRIRSIDSGDTKVDNFEWIFLSYFNNEEIINEFSNN